jgi:hypothetical protein
MRLSPFSPVFPHGLGGKELTTFNNYGVWPGVIVYTFLAAVEVDVLMELVTAIGLLAYAEVAPEIESSAAEMEGFDFPVDTARFGVKFTVAADDLEEDTITTIGTLVGL